MNIYLDNDKSNCCGCGACVNVCPRNAISMKPDEYGFAYPHVDQTICVDCKQINGRLFIFRWKNIWSC